VTQAFLWVTCFSGHPTNSIKALKETKPNTYTLVYQSHRKQKQDFKLFYYIF